MSDLVAHYPTQGARRADLIVHAVGLAFALLGGGILLGLTFGLGISAAGRARVDLRGRFHRHAGAVGRL